MSEVFIQFAIAASIIIGAGILLTISADRIADETGLGRIFIGSIVLAGATSVPEFMVDLNAIRFNQPDLAVGDLLGSSLFNLFILALLDICFRRPISAFSSEFGHHTMSALLSINLTALVGIGILSQLSISFAGVGLFTWIIAFVYLTGLRFTYRRPEKMEKSVRWKELVLRKTFIKALIGILISAGIILVVAPYLIEAADQIAHLSGLGHTFVGTTLVALSTSLPELVATFVAFRIGAPDLAIANIFGSNTFNMILLLPLDIYYPGIIFSSVHPGHALTAFCVVTVTSIATLGQMSRKREKIRLWEPSSPLIVFLTLGFLYLLFVVKNN